jgi:phosphoglycolate phosphatase-like HAD superfamily hydrolase
VAIGALAMPLDVIICDWNGTLIEYPDERPVLENTARDVFKASFPFHPFRMARIFRARRELEELYRRGRSNAEPDFIRALFRIYNERIIEGVPVSVVLSSIAKYARKRQTQAKLEHRVLRPIRECHHAGKTTGIFSAGYEYGIERILAVAGYAECFDFIEADKLKTNRGEAFGFGLDIYKRKPQFLLRLLKDKNLDASKVAYLGDSEDDEGCFEMVGYPVMAFLATDELKQKFARKYKAFVPRDENDLAEYLGRT